MTDQIFSLTYRFDAASWELPQSPHPVALVTWDVSLAPCDGGPPEELGDALAALPEYGTLVFPSLESLNLSPVGQFSSGLLGRRRTTLFEARTAADLAQAFNTEGYPWHAGRQMLFLWRADTATGKSATRLMQTCLETSALPVRWPSDLLLIVKAAVDGAGAGLYATTPDDLARYAQLFCPP